MTVFELLHEAEACRERARHLVRETGCSLPTMKTSRMRWSVMSGPLAQDDNAAGRHRGDPSGPLGEASLDRRNRGLAGDSCNRRSHRIYG